VKKSKLLLPSHTLIFALLAAACGGNDNIGGDNDDDDDDDSASSDDDDDDTAGDDDDDDDDDSSDDDDDDSASDDDDDDDDTSGDDDDDSSGGDDDDDDDTSGDDDDDDELPEGDDGGPNEDPKECTASADPGGFTFKEIPVWRDGATAAYAMIHDDLCGPALDGIYDNAIDALVKRNLSATVGPFVEACEDRSDRDFWKMLNMAQARHIDIGNHSYTHANITVENAPEEVKKAKEDFDKELEKPVEFYIYPYDYFTPETIKAVGDAGHIGARAGTRDDNDGFDNPPINPSTDPGPGMDGSDLQLEFDVWPRTYSKYALFYPLDILTVHAYNAIEKKGFAIREFHSVSSKDEPGTDEGFGPISRKDYEAHLDFLIDAWKKNVLWTAGATEIVKYRHARTACSASVSGDKITYTVSDDCKKWATPISVIVETENDVNSIVATQDGNPVRTRKLAAKTFSVFADPTLGDVELGGCEDKGAEVDPDISLPAKPEAAKSVCDIVTIKGDGSDGQMDNLERPVEEFQVLPNPEQKDKRDGSWSWYPQNVTVEMKDKALHYAGSGVMAWSGTTLAFLGGNGAGTCYDASAYQGIKFKVKGTVKGSGSGVQENQIIVSLVTAETQTRKFGGDLAGEGGHFNKIIDITADWTEVKIAWADLNKPTWGDTASLTAVANAKLQAIDWGIHDKATEWDVWIDEIALY
jgi:peptidoglycan/xylan/chitin deacetylase (PgdA/CDA1 family)